MAKKKFFGLFGTQSAGYRPQPDAMAAIQAARKGKCKLAMKRLFDASPHIQGYNDKEEVESHRVASIIVAQHCGKDTGGYSHRGEYRVKKGVKGNKYVSAAFSGATARKRKPKRRR